MNAWNRRNLHRHVPGWEKSSSAIWQYFASKKCTKLKADKKVLDFQIRAAKCGTDCSRLFGNKKCSSCSIFVVSPSHKCYFLKLRIILQTHHKDNRLIGEHIRLRWMLLFTNYSPGAKWEKERNFFFLVNKRLIWFLLWRVWYFRVGLDFFLL